MHPAAQIADPRKPLLRGVLHQVSFFVAVAAGAWLIHRAPPGRAAWSAAVYALSLATLLGVSALYHRLTWPPRVRVWMRRLDHSAIFTLIAGTYTPIIAAQDGGRGNALALVWLCAGAGVLKSMFWPYAPKWLVAGLCVAMGWGGVLFAPAVAALAGPGTLWVMAIGGLLYSVGAVIYALKRPNPLPGVFGYHEVFHALVVGAAACHFSMVAALIERIH